MMEELDEVEKQLSQQAFISEIKFRYPTEYEAEDFQWFAVGNSSSDVSMPKPATEAESITDAVEVATQAINKLEGAYLSAGTEFLACLLSVQESRESDD